MLDTYQIADFINQIKVHKDYPLFFDIETENLYFRVSLCSIRHAGITYLIEIESDEEQDLLKSWLEEQWVVGFNLSYDLGTLAISPRKIDDLFYLIKIAYPEIQEFNLDKIDRYFKLGFYTDIDKKEMQKGMLRGAYRSQKQLQYSAADVEVLEKLWELDRVQIIREKNLAYKLGIYALSESLIWQENGLPVRKDKLDQYLIDLRQKDQDFSEQLEILIGYPLNPRSSKQIIEFFGTNSSDKATMTRIAIDGYINAVKSDSIRMSTREEMTFDERDQKIAELILLARKAKNDLTKLEKYIGKKKMYGRFNPMGASTSRWTCKGTKKGQPRQELFNAQNYSRDYKSVFGVAEDSDQIIVSADYATLEIRIAACIMGEENMYHALMEGIDIHKSTASLLFNKDVEKVTGKERSNAKVANFGLTYGMGLETFKNYAYDMYGIKFKDEEAKELISKFFIAYPGLKEYHLKVGKLIRRNNYICQTALGYRMKPKSYTEAINGPTQGTGAECMRLAIHKMVQKDRRTLDEALVNSIHDAIYLIVKEEEKDYWGEILKTSMQEAWYEVRKSKLFKWHDVPMPVDLMFGKVMGDLEEDFAGGGQALTIAEMKEMRERNKKC